MRGIINKEEKCYFFYNSVLNYLTGIRECIKKICIVLDICILSNIITIEIVIFNVPDFYKKKSKHFIVQNK